MNRKGEINLPKGTPKAKVVSINAFEHLQEKFTELQKRYDSLLQTSSDASYFREARTSLEEENRVISNRNDGLSIALAICGNRIATLDSSLVHVTTELSESWQRAINESDNSVKVCNTNCVEESLGQTEPSNPPIQPTTRATIKSKPKTTKAKKTIRRKK